MRNLLVAASLLSLAVAGCGTKGALVLPPTVKEPPRQASPVQLRDDSSKITREAPTQ